MKLEIALTAIWICLFAAPAGNRADTLRRDPPPVFSPEVDPLNFRMQDLGRAPTEDMFVTSVALQPDIGGAVPSSGLLHLLRRWHEGR